MIISTQHLIELFGRCARNLWKTQVNTEVSNLPPNDEHITAVNTEVANLPPNRLEHTQDCVEVAFGPMPAPLAAETIVGSVSFSGAVSTVPPAPPTVGVVPSPIPIECFFLVVNNPADGVHITLDWEGWLGTGDGIFNAAWTAEPGVNISGSSKTLTLTTVAAVIPAAADGEEYLITCTIVTQLGRIEARRVRVAIRTANFSTSTGTGWWRV